jgi:AcrR family transcriptional regulator
VAKTGRLERRKEETSRRLLDAAMAVFSLKGVHLATVEDITERADVGKGTFYDYFPSKSAIIHRLVQLVLVELRVGLESRLSAGRGRGEVVSRLLEAEFEFFEKRPDLLVFLHQVRGLLKLRPETMRAIRVEYDGHIDFLVEKLKPAFRQKRWSEARLRQVACALAGSVAGYLSFATISAANGAVGQRWDVPKRIFLHGVYRS